MYKYITSLFAASAPEKTQNAKPTNLNTVVVEPILPLDNVVLKYEEALAEVRRTYANYNEKIFVLRKDDKELKKLLDDAKVKAQKLFNQLIDRGYEAFSDRFFLDQLDTETVEKQKSAMKTLDQLSYDYGMENEYAVIDMGRPVPYNGLGDYGYGFEGFEPFVGNYGYDALY